MLLSTVYGENSEAASGSSPGTMTCALLFFALDPSFGMRGRGPFLDHEIDADDDAPVGRFRMRLHHWNRQPPPPPPLSAEVPKPLAPPGCWNRTPASVSRRPLGSAPSSRPTWAKSACRLRRGEFRPLPLVLVSLAMVPDASWPWCARTGEAVFVGGLEAVRPRTREARTGRPVWHSHTSGSSCGRAGCWCALSSNEARRHSYGNLNLN